MIRSNTFKDICLFIAGVLWEQIVFALPMTLLLSSVSKFSKRELTALIGIVIVYIFIFSNILMAFWLKSDEYYKDMLFYLCMFILPLVCCTIGYATSAADGYVPSRFFTICRDIAMPVFYLTIAATVIIAFIISVSIELIKNK